jgi:hypothetical protein
MQVFLKGIQAMKRTESRDRTVKQMVGALVVPVVLPVVGVMCPVWAQTPSPSVVAPPTPATNPPAPATVAINVTVDGQAVPFPTQGPVFLNGMVYVPLRGVFERLGVKVDYDGPTRTVKATRATTVLTFQTEADATGTNSTQPQVGERINGTVMLPLRLVAETLGAQVAWDAGARVVRIISGQAKSASPASVATAQTPATPTPTTPANPPTPPPAPMPPAIASVSHDGGEKLLRAGNKLTVTVTGEAGLTGKFSAPGLPLAFDVPLTENAGEPGTYTGVYTVPEGAPAMGATVTATLIRGEMEASANATAPVKVDGTGPQPENLTPGENATVKEARPQLSAQISDPSGVDANQTRLVIDGKDVTAQTKRSATGFSYQPPTDWENGTKQAELIMRDKAGNESRLAWKFTVALPPKPIRSIVISPRSRTLGYNETLQVRVLGLPGASVGANVGSLKVAFSEVMPGEYVGNYTVKPGDQINAPVVVTLTPKDGKPIVQNGPEPVSLSATAPVAPVIDTPLEGARIKDNVLVVTGRTLPSAVVRIGVSYEGKDFFKKKEGTLDSKEVTANEDGVWTSGPIGLDATRSLSGLKLTVSAVSVAPWGAVSPPSTVRLKR